MAGSSAAGCSMIGVSAAGCSVNQAGAVAVRSSGFVINSSGLAPWFWARDSSQARASSWSEGLVPGPLTSAESGASAAGSSAAGCSMTGVGAAGVSAAGCSVNQAGTVAVRSSGFVINSSGLAPWFWARDSSQARASSWSEALVPGPLTSAESGASEAGSSAAGCSMTGVGAAGVSAAGCSVNQAGTEAVWASGLAS